MKVLLMPVPSQSRTHVDSTLKRHFEALRLAGSVTVALACGLAATLVLACLLAFSLALILGVVAAAAAMLIFMVVHPEGNLLLLLLLSQLWLLYAPRKTAPERQPDGGLTIKPQPVDGGQKQGSLAA